MLSTAPIRAYIPVSNLQRARQFYEKTVGLEPGEEHGGGVLYHCGGVAVFMYQTPNAGTSKASPAVWQGADVGGEVAELQTRAVVVQEYDTAAIAAEARNRADREREARAQVVHMAGDRRAAGPPHLGTLSGAQPADGPEDAGSGGRVGEVGPGAGRTFEGLTQHSRQQSHRYRGGCSCHGLLAGQSHAAPRTPLESPWAARTMRVAMGSEPAPAANK